MLPIIIILSLTAGACKAQDFDLLLTAQHQTVLSVPTIDRTGLLVEWAMDGGSGNVLTNLAGDSSSIPVDNIFPASENHFATTAYKWLDGVTVGTVTITDGYATGPSGVANTASRWQCTAAANSLKSASLLRTVAGNYTVSLYVKSNTGASQTFRFGYYVSGWVYSSDFTATTDWQRFEWTFSPGAGTGRYVAYMVNGSGGAAVDLQIYGVKLEQANSATPYVSMDRNWNANLGRYRFYTNNWSPNWVSTGLNHPSASTRFAGGFGNATLANVSVYAAFKRSGTPNLGRYAYLVQSIFTDNKLLLAADDSLGKATFKFNNTSVFGDTGWNDGRWHVAAGIYDGSALKLYLDGTVLQSAAATLGSVTLTDLNTSTGNDQAYFSGDMAYVLLYNTAHNHSMVSNTFLAISNKLSARSITIDRHDTFIAAEADSRTAMDDTFQRQAITNLYPAKIAARIFAVSGSRFSVMTNRAADLDASFGAGRSNNICTVLVGINDYDTMTPSTYINDVRGYCNQRRAAGWKVILCTELPCKESVRAGWNAKRAEYNALIRADSSCYDALCDLAADPTMGPDAAADNTTLYSDGLHPSAAGHKILSTNLSATISALIQ